MSQKKLDTISNGGTVNDVPKFEIPTPEDLFGNVAPVPVAKKVVTLDLTDAREDTTRKRKADPIMDRLEVQREINRLMREQIDDLRLIINAQKARIDSLEKDLGAAWGTIHSNESCMQRAEGMSRVCYKFVKLAEQQHIVAGWQPMQQQRK
jgi:hypothetical protein